MKRESGTMLVAVYADESCLGNGREGENPGGAGGLIELMNRAKLARYDYWLSEPGTTNNRMALRSAIEALTILSRKGKRCRIVFTSDSRYLVDGNTQWLRDWIKRGWRRRSGTIENLSLWQELAAARAAHDVEWRWVRGHDGHPQNEYANHLATRAAASQTSSAGAVPSRFDEWLTGERAKGRMTLEPFPLPDARRFTPTPPLPREDSSSLWSTGTT
ncbi:MAG: ribonuclease HI [Anaerolineae bacterium]|nr:ribonuclease HI [Gemmatimonadaceae bacterium]